MPESAKSIQLANSPVTVGELRNIIAAAGTSIKLERLSDTTRFRNAGADSLDIFNIILAIEDKYKLQIPGEDLGKLGCLVDMAAYLNLRFL